MFPKKEPVCCPRINTYVAQELTCILAKNIHVCCQRKNTYAAQEKTRVLPKLHLRYPRKNMYAAEVRKRVLSNEEHVYTKDITRMLPHKIRFMLPSKRHLF